MPKAETAFSRTRRDLRHHDRLALRQPADEGAIRRRFHARDRRERRRGIPGQPRRPGRLRAAQPAARRRGARAGGLRRGDRRRSRCPAARAGPSSSTRDEHPRADTTLEALAKLKPIVRAGGTVTAGNASGVNDGAAALIVASRGGREATRPARRSRASSAWRPPASPPRIMGIGPVPATQKLLRPARPRRSATSTSIELNEAFASQALACCASSASPTTPRT